MAGCIPGKLIPYPEPPAPTITENYTYPFAIEEYSTWEVGLKITAYVVAMTLAIAGNAFVLLIVIMNRHNFSVASVILYMGNLAVSDLMVGVLIMWVHLVSGIQENWPFGSAVCKIYPFLQIVFLSASVFFMALIAIDRLLATVYPMKWRVLKLWMHGVVIIIAWILSIIGAIPILIVRKRFELIWADRHQTWCSEQWPRYASHYQPNITAYGCQYYYPERQIYYNCLVVFMYFVPVLVMVIAYGIVLCKVTERKVPGQTNEKVLTQQRHYTKRAFQMLFAVLAAFLLCWTPQEVIVFMDANWPTTTAELSNDLRYALIFIAYFNSSINPIIYAGLNDKIQKGFKELFYRRCQRKIEPASVRAGSDYNNNNGHSIKNHNTSQ